MDSNDPHRPDSESLPNRSKAAIETLIRFDELGQAELAELKTDPSAAQAISLMESAQTYLESGGLAESSVSADELYAYGSGPGAQRLDADRHAEVERHLSSNHVETTWVEGLQVAPPSPLILDRDGAELFGTVMDADESAEVPSLGVPSLGVPSLGPKTESQEPIPSISPRSPQPMPTAPAAMAAATGVNWFVWSPLAAAALVLAMAIGGGTRPSAMDGALPDSPILRSGERGKLLFPRGRVLGAKAPSRAFAARPLFEIAPSFGSAPEASVFRYELRRLDAPMASDSSSALFAAGESLWTVESEHRSITANPLPTGDYEWTAWETIDGIDRELGTMAFQVVLDPDWGAATLGASGAPEAIIRERVRELHASGYLTDARSLVRALPPSEERSSYLDGQ